MNESPAVRPESKHAEQQRGVRVLILLRFLIVSASFVIFVVPLQFVGFSAFEKRFWPIYVIFILVFFLNFLYRAYVSRVRNFEMFTFIQIVLDITLVSGLIYFTGANYSNFVFLYFAAILASSILTTSKKGFLLTNLCSSLLVIITAVYHTYIFGKGALPPFSIIEVIPEPGESIYLSLGYLAIEILSFYMVFFLLSDLTSRLKSVKLLYDEVLLNLADGMIITDRANRIQFINQEALKLFRFETRPFLVGKNLEEVFRRETDRELKNILASHQNVKSEIEFSFRSDVVLPIALQTSVIIDEKGRHRFTIATFRDLSLVKKAHETEKRLTRLEAIREMSTEIAHEIKNPLASILGSVQELAKLPMDDTLHDKLIKIVWEETERINEIVNGFLTFARIRPTKLEKCNMSSILEEIVIMLQNRIQDQNISIKKDIPAGLFCDGDTGQLKQLFLNIGINAVESIKNSGTVKVTAALKHPESQVDPNTIDRRRPVKHAEIEVNITDTGMGIEPGITENIFQPFFTTKSSGTGMGLSIADWIIHAHNAKISWKSKQGKGTTFTMLFPAISA